MMAAERDGAAETGTLPPMSDQQASPTTRPDDAATAAEIQKALTDAMDSIGLTGAGASPYGTGVTSIVFLVRPTDSRPLAIKIPRRRTEMLIRREADILRWFRCDHIPTLASYDESGRFLVREFVEGPVLELLVPSTHHNRATTLQLLSSLVRAASTLFAMFHEVGPPGLAIGDLRPANLVYRIDAKTLVLVDLGMMFREDLYPKRTRLLGGGIGMYKAPELLLPEGEPPDRKIDYFSFGATAYFILFGRPPYENRERDPAVARRNYAERHPRLLADLDAKGREFMLPPRLVDFIGVCLEPEPSRRPRRFPPLPAMLPI
jgi:serine/threonine protein kinase